MSTRNIYRFSQVFQVQNLSVFSYLLKKAQIFQGKKNMLSKYCTVFLSILVLTYALSTSDDIAEWNLFKVNSNRYIINFCPKTEILVKQSAKKARNKKKTMIRMTMKCVIFTFLLLTNTILMNKINTMRIEASFLKSVLISTVI